MNGSPIPDLTFPRVVYSQTETPWDLLPLLYKGGANQNVREVARSIASGSLGAPVEQRIPLVQELHQHIAATFAAGGSRHTTWTCIRTLRRFYAWADEIGCSPSLTSAAGDFIEWSEHLLRVQRATGRPTMRSLYSVVSTVAGLLDRVLGRTIGLMRSTRIEKGRKSKRALGTQADKQDLANTFAFGAALLDICDALSTEVIFGPLPVRIHLRSGHVLEEWSHLAESCKSRRVSKKRAAWIAGGTLRTRQALVNMRVEAELLMFIAQTGMNLAQACKLKARHFSYQSHLDGYLVRQLYKRRRMGEVQFEIFSEYRTILERYVTWREEIYPDDKDGPLFPICGPQRRAAEVAPQMRSIRKKLSVLGIACPSLRELRSTRVNWLLRRSQDPALTAEMSQHTQETLLRDYVRVHHQTAVTELARFHAATDPAVSPPGPGLCAQPDPVILSHAPQSAPRPDCVNPAGCLFCENHRDVDSMEHMWSLASYRHYKTLELARYRPAENQHAVHPAISVVERVTAKLRHFGQSSALRSTWVDEAASRVAEGDYHPKWDGFIRLMEVGA